MGFIWKHPALTGLEVAWRWAAGVPLLCLAAFWLERNRLAVAADIASIRTLSFLAPLHALKVLGEVYRSLGPRLGPLLAWALPVAVLFWTACGTAGRSFLTRSLQRGRCYAWRPVFLLRLLRTLGVLLIWALWVALLVWAAQRTVAAPAAHGQEPDVVAFMGYAIPGSLALFSGWAAASWPLTLAELFAATTGSTFAASLRGAFTAKRLRGQVLEVNLVLCIVRLALLVLAMVFSACPLPFEAVSTPRFLLIWTTCITLLYLLASDYFHVVRFAAYNALFRAAER